MSRRGRGHRSVKDRIDDRYGQVHPLNQMEWPVPGGVQLSGARSAGEVTAASRRLVARLGRDPEAVPESEAGDDGWLNWNIDLGERPDGMAKPTPRLLFVFAALADKAPKRYEKFAARYGPLDLCEHDKPASHVPFTVSHDLSVQAARDQDRRWRAAYWAAVQDEDGLEPLELAAYPEPWSCRRPPLAAESVAIWRRYARQAQTMIEIIGELACMRPVQLDRWKPLASLFGDEPMEASVGELPEAERADHLPAPHAQKARDEARERNRQAVIDQREVLAYCIDQWLQLGGIRPRFTWPRGGSNLDLIGPGGLFAALALQLADLPTAEKPDVRCVNCGRLYRPTRTPRLGEDTFCRRDDCKASRKQRYRQRRAESG